MSTQEPTQLADRTLRLLKPRVQPTEPRQHSAQAGAGAGTSPPAPHPPLRTQGGESTFSSKHFWEAIQDQRAIFLLSPLLQSPFLTLLLPEARPDARARRPVFAFGAVYDDTPNARFAGGLAPHSRTLRGQGGSLPTTPELGKFHEPQSPYGLRQSSGAKQNNHVANDFSEREREGCNRKRSRASCRREGQPAPAGMRPPAATWVSVCRHGS